MQLVSRVSTHFWRIKVNHCNGYWCSTCCAQGTQKREPQKAGPMIVRKDVHRRSFCFVEPAPWCCVAMIFHSSAFSFTEKFLLYVLSPLNPAAAAAAQTPRRTSFMKTPSSLLRSARLTISDGVSFCRPVKTCL